MNQPFKSEFPLPFSPPNCANKLLMSGESGIKAQNPAEKAIGIAAHAIEERTGHWASNSPPARSGHERYIRVGDNRENCESSEISRI